MGRAHRPVVGHVGGPGPTGVRVPLLIRVEPVVAPADSRPAAHSARRDLPALTRGRPIGDMKQSGNRGTGSGLSR